MVGSGIAVRQGQAQEHLGPGRWRLTDRHTVPLHHDVPVGATGESSRVKRLAATTGVCPYWDPPPITLKLRALPCTPSASGAEVTWLKKPNPPS